MQIRVNVPDELAKQAQARGVPIQVYVEELLAEQAADSSEEYIEEPLIPKAKTTPAESKRARLATRQIETPSITPVPAPESPEMAWLVQNAQELARHKGEWLLIQGTELLVHSRDFAAVRAAVQERQIRSPFVYYVPTDQESNSVSI